MTQQRLNISTGSPWEPIVGYSRAVRIGNVIEIAGTVAVENGEVVGKGDPYAQTICILKKIEGVLQEAGATLQDVIRTRLFVTDISSWEDIGRAHGEFFKDIRPVTSMLEVSALIDGDYLVEIEVTAVVGL